jgi:hypothetical protein
MKYILILEYCEQSNARGLSRIKNSHHQAGAEATERYYNSQKTTES